MHSEPGDLRIVFDARSVGRRASGIGNYAHALLKNMVACDNGVRFLVLRQRGAPPLFLPENKRVEELECAGEAKSVSTVLRLGRTRHGFADYDLYHSPCELVPLGLRCPWVVTVHDLMWVEAPRLASRFLPVRVVNAVWYRLNFDHAFHGAAALIAISQATADAVERVYPQHAAKTRVVHHGIDRERFGRAPPRARLDRYLPRNRRYSLIVGQGSPYKNHLRLVRAFAEAMRDRPDHALVLVRRFTRVDFEMTRLLASAEVEKRVVLIPHVDDEDLLALYRYARMLLFASLYEGFGMPVLEAMAMGTPVLASTAPALLEVTGSAALHAVPDDHEDLVSKIRRLDEDDALRRRLIEEGLRRVRDFSWERCARDTLAIYREVTDGGSTPVRSLHKRTLGRSSG